MSMHLTGSGLTALVDTSALQVGDVWPEPLFEACGPIVAIEFGGIRADGSVCEMARFENGAATALGRTVTVELGAAR